MRAVRTGGGSRLRRVAAFAGRRRRRRRRRWSIRSSRSGRSRRAWPAGADASSSTTTSSSSSEKATGQVKRVRDGDAPRVMLDLTVNSNSERGLLGIALDKYFSHNGFVYLYWSETTTGGRQHGRRRRPAAGQPARPLPWDGTALTFDEDAAPRARAAGRRDQPHQPGGAGLPRQPQRRRRPRRPGRQDLPAGRRHRPPRADAEPVRRAVRSRRGASADDQFGGPDPDNDHLTGVILRLNHGRHGAARQPVLQGRRRARRPGRREPEEDLRLRPAQRLRHGVRPVQRRPVGAGERRRLLQRDQPRRARLQLRLDPGHGPARARRAVQGDRDHPRPDPRDPARPAATTASSRSAGTRSTSPTRPREAYDRLFKLPGSRFSDPEMAWKYEVAPGGIDFVSDRGARQGLQGRPVRRLGPRRLRGGNLFRLPIENNRKEVDVPTTGACATASPTTSRKYDITESESLLFGENFGVTPDVKESPDGHALSSSPPRWARSTRSARSSATSAAAGRRAVPAARRFRG